MKSLSVRWTLGAALVVVFAGWAQHKKPSVYVLSDAAGSPGISKSKAKELSDSAEDLRRQIKKRKGLVLARQVESADILVTILDRRVEIAQTRQDYYGGGHTQQQYQSRHVIRYRIETKDSSQEGEYYNVGSLVTWTRVAGGLSKQIERMVTGDR